MVDELEKDFKESGIRSKSQYLTHLIGLGLNAKKSTTAIADIAGIAQELQSIKSLVSDLQRQILREQTENEIYKELLCYLHYLLECIIYEEEPNYEQTELGIHDILPTRLYDKLKKLREVYGVA